MAFEESRSPDRDKETGYESDPKAWKGDCVGEEMQVSVSEDEANDEEPKDDVLRGKERYAEHQDTDGEENTDTQFDQCIANRKWMFAFAAASAKHEPAKYWNVEPWFDRLVTVRTFRCGNDGESAWEAIDKDVEEAAEGEAENKGADGVEDCFGCVGHVSSIVP